MVDTVNDSLPMSRLGGESNDWVSIFRIFNKGDIIMRYDIENSEVIVGDVNSECSLIFDHLVRIQTA